MYRVVLAGETVARDSRSAAVLKPSLQTSPWELKTGRDRDVCTTEISKLYKLSVLHSSMTNAKFLFISHCFLKFENIGYLFYNKNHKIALTLG